MSWIPPRHRIRMVFDEFEEAPLPSSVFDPIGFPGYADALSEAAGSSGGEESVVAGSGLIGSHPVEAVLFDFGFLGGSMGVRAGAAIEAAMGRALNRRVPFLAITSTGGARMQEGMAALAQMPLTVAASSRLAEAGIPRISVLGHPTTGGVYASFASLADVLIADEHATVGFAGPRVSAAATGKALPSGSHTAESAFRAGLVDLVVPPEELKANLIRVLGILAPATPEPAPARIPAGPVIAEGDTPSSDAWDEYQLARHPDRPTNSSYISHLFPDAFLFHGDRSGSNDPGVITGLARFEGRPLVFAALNGTNPRPSGYRKAQQAIRLAGRYRVPLVTFIDTPGADATHECEIAGIAAEIARTFEALLSVDTPVLTVITGEGGSGGALALAVGDAIAIQEHAVFSVIAPEGAATILYREPERADEIAPMLRPTSRDLVQMGLADVVLPESGAGAHESREESAEIIAGWLSSSLESVTADREARAARYRNLRAL